MDKGNMQNLITIDGPSGSGKSTVGRLLAKRIRFLYLDTGAMYRAVALAAKRRGTRLDDGKSLGELCRSLHLEFDTDHDPPRLLLDQKDISLAIRSPEMDMLSSRVSAIREVREAMTGLQRKMAEKKKFVAEGRDMGTVVFPHAKHKFFFTATQEVRAERRYKERLERGEQVSKDRVEKEMHRRDREDQDRTLAPLKPAEDAEVVDTTHLSPDEVVDRIVARLDLD